MLRAGLPAFLLTLNAAAQLQNTQAEHFHLLFSTRGAAPPLVYYFVIGLLASHPQNARHVQPVHIIIFIPLFTDLNFS